MDVALSSVPLVGIRIDPSIRVAHSLHSHLRLSPQCLPVARAAKATLYLLLAPCSLGIRRIQCTLLGPFFVCFTSVASAAPWRVIRVVFRRVNRYYSDRKDRSFVNRWLTFRETLIKGCSDRDGRDRASLPRINCFLPGQWQCGDWLEWLDVNAVSSEVLANFLDVRCEPLWWVAVDLQTIFFTLSCNGEGTGNRVADDGMWVSKSCWVVFWPLKQWLVDARVQFWRIRLLSWYLCAPLAELAKLAELADLAYLVRHVLTREVQFLKTDS